jgi:hypothetical protein
MATERLKFNLELYATTWDKPPYVEIFLDKKNYWQSEILGSYEKPTVIEFEAGCEEGSEYNLVIKRSGKTADQTIVNTKGDIKKDQLLHIKSITIDEIDIGALVYEGVYTPDYPEPWATQQREAGVELQESFNKVTCIGHNGEWRLSFASPFYVWILENLY